MCLRLLNLKKYKSAKVMRTIFGWTVKGPSERKGSLCRTANAIISDLELNKQCASSCDQEFNDSRLRQDYWYVKGRPTCNKHHGTVYCPKRRSQPTGLALENLSALSSKQQDLAEHRLKLLRRRMQIDQELLSKYSSFMDSLVKNCHARKFPKKRLNQPVVAGLCLLHPVFNPNKPD